VSGLWRAARRASSLPSRFLWKKTARKPEMLLYGERGRMIALRDWAGQNRGRACAKKVEKRTFFSKVRAIRFHRLAAPNLVQFVSFSGVRV